MDKEKVTLRDATEADLELILAWRNSPLIWHGLYTQHRENRPLTWEEHYRFWTSEYRKTWKRFIIQVNDGVWTRDVGYIQFGQLDHWRPEVSVVIGEVSLWGKGVGNQALTLGIEWLKSKGYRRLHTSIIKENERAIRLFESVGFKRIGEAREGEWEYEKWIM